MVSYRRLRTRSVVTLLAVAVTGLTLHAGSAGARSTPATPATPTIATVTAKLDSLGRRAEQLAEQYNKARIDAAAAQQRATQLDRAAAAAALDYRAARAHFVEIVTSQYEYGSTNAVAALLTSDSGTRYVEQLNGLALLAQRQADVVGQLTAARATMAAARTRAAATLHAAQAQRAVMKQQRDRVAAQTTIFQTLLGTLTAAQRAAYANRMAANLAAADRAQLTHPATPTGAAHQSGHRRSSTMTVHAGNAAAQRAVDFALAQVGKPYAYGAAGPGSYDCSGLTMAAWRAGGVSLPHLAAGQYDYGTHVGIAHLQPGDLVFMYHPIGHVTIYIGRGLLVSAPQTGENVKIVRLSYYKPIIVGATRLV